MAGWSGFVACDRELAKCILKKANAPNLPVVGANYGTSDGPASCMSWIGEPSSSMVSGEVRKRRPQGCNCNSIKRDHTQKLVSLGEVISEVAAASKKRVAFVASADQGHAHRSDGPYGYNPASAEFDQLVKEAVQRNDL